MIPGHAVDGQGTNQLTRWAVKPLRAAFSLGDFLHMKLQYAICYLMARSAPIFYLGGQF